MIRVKNATPLEGFKLLLTFSNGKQKVFDVEPHLFGEVFEPLRQRAFFERVSVDPLLGTITWPNGADFCADVLYEESTEVDRVRAI